MVNKCECGCGEIVSYGYQFKSTHDSALLERIVQASNGIVGLRDALLMQGMLPLNEFPSPNRPIPIQPLAKGKAATICRRVHKCDKAASNYEALFTSRRNAISALGATEDAPTSDGVYEDPATELQKLHNQIMAKYEEIIKGFSTEYSAELNDHGTFTSSGIYVTEGIKPV